ncbi:MAG: carbon-nitrogen hydrolase family protein [Bdellovibrionales bacterium]|nr:carbon-nitrogen hydrolase family protein [Bdellovibrionales bacterium]
MLIRLVQMCTTNSKTKNINNIIDHLNSQNVSIGEMICFPENSLFLRATRKDPVETFTLNDPEIGLLKDWCVNKQVFMHLGAIPLAIDNKVYNASVRISMDGKIESQYKKIHLFDVDVEGQVSIRESDTYTAGTKESIFTYDGWKIGESICYDLRFPALYLSYAQKEVDAIMVPSSFLHVTGKAHWEVLLRARAIETQSYIIAPAQGGVHMGLHRTWGHSMVVDPWGEIIAEIKTETDLPQSVVVELDKSKIESVRKQIPLRLHRKPIV